MVSIRASSTKYFQIVQAVSTSPETTACDGEMTTKTWSISDSPSMIVGLIFGQITALLLTSSFEDPYWTVIRDCGQNWCIVYYSPFQKSWTLKRWERTQGEFDALENNYRTRRHAWNRGKNSGNRRKKVWFAAPAMHCQQRKLKYWEYCSFRLTRKNDAEREMCLWESRGDYPKGNFLYGDGSAARSESPCVEAVWQSCRCLRCVQVHHYAICSFIFFVWLWVWDHGDGGEWWWWWAKNRQTATWRRRKQEIQENYFQSYLFPTNGRKYRTRTVGGLLTCCMYGNDQKNWGTWCQWTPSVTCLGGPGKPETDRFPNKIRPATGKFFLTHKFWQKPGRFPNFVRTWRIVE